MLFIFCFIKFSFARVITKKMYNGIGLKTPRGSGTSGYVQRNLSFVRPKANNYIRPEDLPPPKTHKPSQYVLLHKSKRQIELECLELQEQLEAEG